MTIWAIEIGIETEYELALAASAEKAGCRVYKPGFLPFGNETSEPMPNWVYGRVIFHGSLQGARIARSLYDWEVYENAPELCCQFYYPRLKEKLLNREHIFLPYGCLNYSKQKLFDWLGEEDCIFVRPDTNRKSFSGKLVEAERWNENIELIGLYDVPPEELCVIAPPVNIKTEWRFFVSRGQVITGSKYRENGQAKRELANEEDTSSAQELLDFCSNQGYAPDPIWVMDMCETKGGRRCILEVGSFSSSGLYASDTDKIVECLLNLKD